MARSFASIPDQSGRVAVVTGANSGLGEVTATELARQGAHVVLACRSLERGRAAVERLRAEVPGARAEARQVDLADLSSIRAFAAGWDHERLDLLVNNAGISTVPFARTADGFESQFGVNHLGPFALTGLLLPRLLAAPDPRVVTLGSEGHRFARFDPARLDPTGGGRYNTFAAYARSKRANLYFALELQRRAGDRLRSVAAAPCVCRTGILTGGANAGRGRAYHTMIALMLRLAFRPVADGARFPLYAATDPDVPGGSYVAPGSPLKFYGAPAVRTRDRVLRHAEAARALWELSETRTGVRYAFAPA
ncbi:short-chain dehydrogenase [Actinomadura craniellae]|uniref:Short-chain dehydrogenase n=1 Tax=Actinomadura craniellae TaxID=2231787 RepID=A0A365H2I3_9ACTN|nr:SDR family NAD(P)-dependent oxidoreductase [Actinomadura craniellae]RAY13236.1 short-chain dehydrogenase [Actinomadura craniellae]